MLVRVDPKHREHPAGTAPAVRAEETDVDGRPRPNVIFQDARHTERTPWQYATDAEILAPQRPRTSPHRRAVTVAARCGPSD
ncbi:hypothetical protein AB0467_08250 [Streptomyces sp. NPDC052095]|uniref:hypothetical protein n=1 Tax=unclassified Streptomyces TaxID=2593676 RepID=UPI00344D59B5